MIFLDVLRPVCRGKYVTQKRGFAARPARHEHVPATRNNILGEECETELPNIVVCGEGRRTMSRD